LSLSDDRFRPVNFILKIFPSSKNAASLAVEQIKKNEAAQFLNAIQPDDIIVALDENGKQWNSPELASFLENKANANTKNLIFLIGGTYGIHDVVLKRCSYKWSLSKLVFPHQMVRLILAEQVYRACTIIRNEKYHHS